VLLEDSPVDIPQKKKAQVRTPEPISEKRLVVVSGVVVGSLNIALQELV
jgi:hypothetical protein